MSPRVEFVTERVLGPYANVLSTSEEEEFMDLLIEMLPVHNMGHPCEPVAQIEETESELPRKGEGVDKEHVPT